MNKKNIIILVLLLVIVGYLGFLGYNYVAQDAYNAGVQDASNYMYQQIYVSLAEDGSVPFSFHDGEQVRTINLVPYQDPNVRN